MKNIIFTAIALLLIGASAQAMNKTAATAIVRGNYDLIAGEKNYAILMVHGYVVYSEGDFAAYDIKKAVTTGQRGAAQMTDLQLSCANGLFSLTFPAKTLCEIGEPCAASAVIPKFTVITCD